MDKLIRVRSTRLQSEVDRDNEKRFYVLKGTEGTVVAFMYTTVVVCWDVAFVSYLSNETAKHEAAAPNDVHSWEQTKVALDSIELVSCEPSKKQTFKQGIKAPDDMLHDPFD